MKVSILKSVALAAVLTATSAFANVDRKIVINMGGSHYKGQNVLKLKQMIKGQHPGINLKKFKLVGVRLVAKSKHGGGKASLVVGGAQSYKKQLAGQPSDFHVNAGYTFDRLNFSNPKNNSQGVWQIYLKGNIKVKRIVVKLDKKFNGGGFGNKKATCTATLETQWGSDLDKFYTVGYGPSKHVAKSRACAKAMQQCRQKKNSMANGPIGGILLKCSAK